MTAIALAASSVVAAQSADPSPMTWYTVELVIFERDQTLGLDEELWPPEPGEPPLEGSIEFNDAAELGILEDTSPGVSIPLAFQLLPPDQYQLGKLWRRLARSRDYRPLWHAAWRQPGFDQAEAQPVHIRIWRVGERATGDADLTVTNPVEAAIDGTVLLYRARYLHVHFDLLFSPLEPVLIQPTAVPPMDTPAPEPDPAPAEPTVFSFGQLDVEPIPSPAVVTPLSFRLTAGRRMRSKETHYIDHPLFGIIVLATPFELPAMEQAPAPTGEAATPGTPSPESTTSTTTQ